MVEKTLITGLIGIIATMGTIEIADNADGILNEATAIAAVMQERELATALELYYLKHGHYPKVDEAELAAELHTANVLKSDELAVAVSYRSRNNGSSYELSLR